MTEEWFGFEVLVTFKQWLQCSKEDLVNQFSRAYEKMVHLGRELREDRVSKMFKLIQHKLWTRFLEEMGLQCVDLCDLIIMISIPLHSGWVERAYSYLDQVCQKKRNHLNVGNLKELFFFAILKLQPNWNPQWTKVEHRCCVLLCWLKITFLSIKT